MQEIIAIEKAIEIDEDTIEFKLVIPKSLIQYFQVIFYNLNHVANDLKRKAIKAEIESERQQKKRQKKIDERDNLVLTYMRIAYIVEFEINKNIREAMKIITKDFKQWCWLRQRFKREVEAQRDLEIIRLIKQGLTSFQIADRLGLNPGTVRKIISDFKSQNKE